MTKPIKIDIHNQKKKVESIKKNLYKKFSDENADVTCRFLDRLRLENKSHGRIANYGDCIRRVLEIKDDKKVQDWSRSEIEHIHKVIADSDYENSVKKDTLSALKRLYHYSVHDEIADKSKGKEYDPVVSWITPGSFKDKYEKIQAKDLLTDDEILRLIRAIKEIGGRYVKRNIALVFTMFEGAYHPGELFGIGIGGLEIEDDFIRVHTTGKTGPKSLTLVSSFGPIRDWLSEHPYSDDPNAFLFYHNNNDGLITYQAFSNMIKKAQKIAGIKKRVWIYLFRHTALTEYSKKIGNVAKIYGNWSKSSNMLAHYEHLANSDQEDAVLTLHNLKKDEQQASILFSKICTSCKTRNTSDQSYCTKCGNELSKQLAKIREARKESRNSDVKKLEQKVSKKISTIESLLAEQQKLIQELVDGKNQSP